MTLSTSQLCLSSFERTIFPAAETTEREEAELLVFFQYAGIR